MFRPRRPAARRNRGGNPAEPRQSPRPVHLRLSHRRPCAVPRERPCIVVVVAVCAVGAIAHAQRRRVHHRPDRCVCLFGRRAHLLSGADRQQVLSAHRGRARVAARARQAGRLPSPARTGGRNLARLRARHPADAARDAAARAGQFRHGRAATSCSRRRIAGAERPRPRRETADIRDRGAARRSPRRVECDAAVAERVTQSRPWRQGCLARRHCGE